MQTTTKNNRCLMETERDVAHVQYDVINYYTDVNPNSNSNPESATTEEHEQRCSRVNNSLLDVVNSRSGREDYMTTFTTISSTPPIRTKGGGDSSRRTGKESRSSNINGSSTPTLGVNMRVTGQCSQGGRKYMEDQFSVAYQESPLTHELEYAFFGIYDGHGGTEAALYAKEYLMLEIVKQKLFWSDNDEDVLRAIREGYIGTQFAMWREQDKWPRTANGHLSTAGTTASVAFMRREKIYIGHVGDSGIVLGYQNPSERRWRAKQLTTDHKPESIAEKSRIQRSGGHVAIKSGVPRVVWNRPRDPLHRGPIKRGTIVDDIPFLAVARSLGDLWSYNSRCKEFVVSPDPDIKVVKIDPDTFRCLIFGTDGLWNVLTAQEAVDTVREKHIIGECLHEQDIMNPSKALVDRALSTWSSKNVRADNTSVVTVILTPAVSAAKTPTVNEIKNVDLLDTENNHPADLDELEYGELGLELCANIEEQEYPDDTPYSALAKRQLPPELYRNFDCYNEEEELLCEQEEHQTDVSQQRKYWCESLQQTIASWQLTSTMRERQFNADAMLVIAEDEVKAIQGAGAEQSQDMYNSNSCELEPTYDSYVSSASVSGSTEYSFAESYNTLLNEQQQSQQQQLEEEEQQQQQQQHLSMNGMHEILQEQHRYQQQEGYSLTQLETRREQRQVANSNSWHQPLQPQAANYVEHPTEMLALNALLQQERDEEQQVALERDHNQHQQHQQQLLVDASFSCSSCFSCSSFSCASHSHFVYAPPLSASSVATLQDNEFSRSGDEEASMETQHQPQQPLPMPQQQRQFPPSLPKNRQQMRRFRNVPNENHQHVQTRHIQILKPSNINYYSATAVVAANNNNSSSSDVLPGSSSINNINSSSNNNSKIRRRCVNSARRDVIITRHSCSLSLASGSCVSKRQLRSSICQMPNLEMTKRTLRARVLTPPSNSVGNGSNNNNKNNANNNNRKSSHTFNKPATPAAAATASKSVRRLCRSKETRELQRSLRRSTVSSSQFGSGSNVSSSGQFSKPTRLQSGSAIAARPPPSPKKLNAVVPTAALAVSTADLGNRWSLRSSKWQ